MKLGDNGEAFFVEENENMKVGWTKFLAVGTESVNSVFPLDPLWLYIHHTAFVTPLCLTVGPSPPVHLPNSWRGAWGDGGDHWRNPHQWLWCPQEETPTEARALRYPPERRGQLFIRRERQRERMGEGSWCDSTGKSCIRGAVLTTAAQVSQGNIKLFAGWSCSFLQIWKGLMFNNFF